MANVLLITSDEHSPKALGAYGNADVRTPNLDALARESLLHTSAYCTSPICVPSRASMATGRYPHELGCWDNNQAYTGNEARSFGHELSDAGALVVTVGKLHYRSGEDPTGFADQRLAMHVFDKTGSAVNLLRGSRPPRHDGAKMLAEAGVGESPYFAYDRAVADEAISFLRNERPGDRPWAMHVSFASPHFPLKVPARYFSLYEDLEVPEPRDGVPGRWPHHPALEWIRRIQGLDGPIDQAARERAVRAYYGLVSYVDELVGDVLGALEDSGQRDDTVIIYTSDHGEMLGAHGLWKKSLMYEESASVPLMLSGPGIARGTRSDEPVSLVALAGTIVAAALGGPSERFPRGDLARPARAAAGPVFAEYHALWSRNAIYLVRDDRFKYVHYTFEEPQLFDLAHDPDELFDLAGDPAHRSTRQRLDGLLRRWLDPEETDATAKASQHALLAALGGERVAIATGDRFFFTPVPAGGSGSSSEG